ncbi:metalloregulator ArsR/SmtB family transcription factor [Oceanithermus desulfurans]|uniref:DNA-binding transcriptional ArsR family regulator n=1 Tax=Oceanithermus desulfurans TaxID=227924 RepID=A0ABR6P2M6_9DEIN|nr:metalloregulator ArsR/SmtB family transcription factor [Oceanithermus desulfurans]MBB6029427.1 DNA-binding transcriptional ArsR family regulator [Oceanithermus desulfurans]
MLNRLFKALGDPTRRALLGILREGERTAGELAEAFPLARSTLSQHLRVLREAGLVEVEVRGNHRVYRLAASVMEEALAYLLELTQGGEEDEETRAHRPSPGG